MLGGFGFWVDCQKIKTAHPNHSNRQDLPAGECHRMEGKKIAGKYEEKKCNNYCTGGSSTVVNYLLATTPAHHNKVKETLAYSPPG